jgi:hypothetical protein
MMSFEKIDNVVRVADRSSSQGQPNSGRHSPAAPLSFPPRSKFRQGLYDAINIVIGIFFLCSLACSLPLAIYLLWVAIFNS